MMAKTWCGVVIGVGRYALGFQWQPRFTISEQSLLGLHVAMHFGALNAFAAEQR